MADDSEPTYYCTTIVRGETIDMSMSYTMAEILAMRKKGGIINVVCRAEHPSSVRFPALPSNERKPTPYSEALIACSRLHKHALDKKDDELAARAERAMRELLRGSGINGEAPTSRRVRAALAAPDVTLPGVGPRR